jgi:hypothetical protein
MFLRKKWLISDHISTQHGTRALTVDAENFDAIPDKFGALVTASLTATI